MSPAVAIHGKGAESALPQAGGWTLIVAAAGKGTRLGWHEPKTLYPVAGKAILDHILETFAPFCAHTVIVVSDQGAASIAGHLGSRPDVRLAVQARQTGMADAVLTGLRQCHTPLCACVWGDQPYFPLAAIAAAVTALSRDPSLSMAIPVSLRSPAYIHLQFNAQERISQVLQKREGDDMPAMGMSDCSMFFFRAPEMRELLRIAMEDGSLRGKNTGEQNFLPVFPLLRKVLSVPVPETEYCSGINTPCEAESVDAMLRSKLHTPSPR